MNPADRLRDLTSRLGYGDGITEPQADNDTIVAEFHELGGIAIDHAECPVWCDECTDWELPRTCQYCNGSGCGPGTTFGAYEECDFCAGDGRHHQGDHPHLPYGWTAHEQWGVRYDSNPGWPGYPVPSRDIAEKLAAEDVDANTHVVRRMVWESPWEDA